MKNELINKYSPIYGSPFMTWIFMWVNAISDSALYVDWPDCNFYRSDMIYRTHDLFSSIKSPSENTRLYFSWVMPNKMVTWYDDKISRKLKFIENNDNFNVWFVTCMPVTSLLWIQYDNIFTDLDKKKYIFIKSFTDKFRLDWYSLFLREIAKNIDLNENKIKEDRSISIIWFLFDRNEWDCFWNIEEIKRILLLFWIKLDTIWLNWWKFDNLKQVENSSLIVSLPYWEMASKVLSNRLWVDYISTSIPFWINQTIKFIKDITIKLWIDEKIVNEILANELNFIKSKTDFLYEKAFIWKTYIYSWDENLLDWIKDIWNYYWFIFKESYFYNWTKESEIINDDNIDFIIWNSEFDYWWEKTVRFEFSFPSYNKHFILNRPFMWFKWFLNFSEDLYNSLFEF